MKIFHLTNPRHGWIDITFGEYPNGFTLTASDVPNDCLYDLAAATVRLLKGSINETVKFSLEPDFAICRFQRDSDLVSLVINHPHKEASTFNEKVPLRAFAKGLRSELLRIQSRYSAEDGWGQPFPNDVIKNLE